MGKFKIGDIVKPRHTKETVYYIVIDVADFTQQGGKPDVDYETMLIFPVESRISNVDIFTEDSLMPVSRTNEKKYKTILDFVRKEREKKGWFEEPDYIKAIKDNRNAIQLVTKQEKKVVAVIPPRHDIVYYNKIDNVDECLDALNDLDTLHKLFGDEAYLQLKDMVRKRIQELKK